MQEMMSKEKKILIMCPYAGGTAQGMQRYFNKFESDIDFKAIDYAGHGARLGMELPIDFDEFAEDAKNEVLTLHETNFYLFGHSMGGMVVAYIAEEIYRIYGNGLKGIIISSCLSPSQFSHSHLKSKNESDLQEYLCSVRKIPMEVLNNKEFQKHILPVIINDFRLMKDYLPTKSIKLPPCPVACVYGKMDNDVSRKDMNSWSDYTEAEIIWKGMQGSHFYFEEHPKETVVLLSELMDAMDVNFED